MKYVLLVIFCVAATWIISRVVGRNGDHTVIVNHLDSVLVDVGKHSRDSLVIVASRAQKQATHWKQIAAKTQARVDTLIIHADTGKAFVQSQAETDQLQTALDRQQQATADLAVSLQGANGRIDTLTSALTEARDTLLHLHKPQIVGIGCSAGLGIRGLDAVCGVTIKIPLPFGI